MYITNILRKILPKPLTIKANKNKVNRINSEAENITEKLKLDERKNAVAISCKKQKLLFQ